MKPINPLAALSLHNARKLIAELEEGASQQLLDSWHAWLLVQRQVWQKDFSDPEALQKFLQDLGYNIIYKNPRQWIEVKKGANTMTVHLKPESYWGHVLTTR